MEEETELDLESQWPEPYGLDLEALGAATSEDPFMHASVELLKEAGALAILATELARAAPFQRNEAILCGLLVRLIKLGRAMLAATCDLRGEEQLGVSRQVLETAANLLYLTEETDEDRFRAFIMDSLVAEREFLREVNENISGRGKELPIEVRIRRSIEFSARQAGVELEDVPARKSNAWPSIEQRLKVLGPDVYPAFRVGSHGVHGTFEDLFRNHLIDVDGGFEPRLDSVIPRPQPVLATVLVIANATGEYLEAQYGKQVRAAFQDRLDDLIGRSSRVDELHETWLQARRSDE